MQDSLDDYIKLISNQDGKDDRLSHEKLQIILKTAEYKKQCEDYAQNVVELLIDGKIRPQYFMRCLHFINGVLYDDVVEERSVSKICGYPICGHSLPNMPTKQYLIMTNVNKVFDLTERKHYCSNFCYKASKHIKSQIDESPLWFRPIPNLSTFKLLEKTESHLTPGEEIVYGIPKNDAATFTSVSDFAEASLDNVNEIDKVSVQCNEQDNKNLTQLDVPHVDSSTLENQQRELKESIKNVCMKLNIDMNAELKLPAGTSKNQEKEAVKIDVDKMNKVVENIDKLEKLKKSGLAVTNQDSAQPSANLEEVQLPKYAQRIKNIVDKNLHKTTPNISAITEKIKHMKISKKGTQENDNLKQVLQKLKDKDNNSKKSIKLIDAMPNPEQKVNEIELDNILLFKSKLTEKEINMIKSSFKNWLTLESYMYILGEEKVKAILNKENLAQCFDELKLQEKERWQQARYMEICKKLDLKEIAEMKLRTSQSTSLRPVPDYHELKREVKEIDKDVKAFFSGEIIVKPATNATTLEDSELNKEDNLAILPLADATSHNALRKCVFNKSIHKFVKHHLRNLEFEESADLKVFEFIATFKLEAHNVVFKPEQWNVIALMLLYCLKNVDSGLAEALESKDYIEEYCRKKYSNTISGRFFQYINEIIVNVQLFLVEYIKKS